MKEKRHKEILDIIEQMEFFQYQIKELSEKFNVSGMTIRRDLHQLEKHGLIKRVFGGKIVRTSNQNEPNYKLRMYEQTKEKERIATIANNIINKNDIVFLDIGSTCLYIAHKIKNRDITIVTNWIPNMIELSKGDYVKIINTGGEIDKKELNSIGIYAYERLNNFYFNKAIIGVGGIKIDGIYDFRMEIVELKKKVIKNSKEVIVVADHTKFNKFVPVVITRFEENLINKIITSDINKIDKEIIDSIKKNGIEFIS